MREFHELFAARRAKGDVGDDLLSLLLAAIDKPEEEGGMSEAQAIDEAMTLFNGGYHSSSMALTWLLYTLAQHPDVQARVCAEVDLVPNGGGYVRGRDAGRPKRYHFRNMVVKRRCPVALSAGLVELFAHRRCRAKLAPRDVPAAHISDLPGSSPPRPSPLP